MSALRGLRTPGWVKLIVQTLCLGRLGTGEFTFVFCLLAAASAPCADPPAVEWERVFGVEGEDRCWDAQQTKDGGYILAGTAGLPPTLHNDCWRGSLIRTDPQGRLIWQQTYLASCGIHTNTNLYSVRETDDGGFITSGDDINVDFPGQTGALFLKTDANGRMDWSRALIEAEHFCSAMQTRDGGYIAIGGEKFPTDRIYLVKTDRSGAPEWTRTFESSFGGHADQEVQQTSDGGYIVVGCKDSGDAYVVKTDSLGTEEWSWTFGQTGNFHPASSVQQTRDGGYIVGCSIQVECTQVACRIEGYLVKVDASGKEVWRKGFGHGVESPHGVIRVRQTADGGYVLSGFTGHVVKTDGEGNTIWSSLFGHPPGGSHASQHYVAQQTQDGGYMVAGHYTDDEGPKIFLVKLAPDTLGPVTFQRGDSDAGGALNLTDAVFTLSYLFQSGPAPGCLDAADADDNGAAQITDAIFTLNHLFLGGPVLPAPSGSCGTDPSEDELGCESFQACP